MFITAAMNNGWRWLPSIKIMDECRRLHLLIERRFHSAPHSIEVGHAMSHRGDGFGWIMWSKLLDIFGYFKSWTAKVNVYHDHEDSLFCGLQQTHPPDESQSPPHRHHGCMVWYGMVWYGTRRCAMREWMYGHDTRQTRVSEVGSRFAIPQQHLEVSRSLQ